MAAEGGDVGELLSRLQAHVPFLKDMIINLKSDMPQHAKIVALHSMIADKKRKFKYETLLKCEEVIIKMQAKTHYKAPPESPKDDFTIHSPDPDTASSSRLEPLDRYINEKPSVYSSAAESIGKSQKNIFERLGAIIPEPDKSKPPISVADLELLKSDYVEPLVDKPATVEPVKKERTPSKVSLVPAPLNKPRPKLDTLNDKTDRKVDIKDKPKIEKIIKDVDSIFGSFLSNIDKKMLVHNRGNDSNEVLNKEEEKRRDSNEGLKREDEKRRARNEGFKSEETKRRDIEECIPRQGGTQNLKVVNKKVVSLDEIIERNMVNDQAKRAIIQTPIVDKQPEIVYKRLADKYNPKPRKPTSGITCSGVIEDLLKGIKEAQETKIPFILSPEHSPLENVPKVDPRLQSKNNNFNKPAPEGLLPHNGFSPPSHITFPNQSPSYMGPSPSYNNPRPMRPPHFPDNRNFGQNRFPINPGVTFPAPIRPQFPNNPNIRVPMHNNFPQNHQNQNFQNVRMPSPHQNVCPPSPHQNIHPIRPPHNMHNKQNLPNMQSSNLMQNTNYNPFMTSQMRPQDPRGNPNSQPIPGPTRPFTPFEPLHNENESTPEYFPPAGSTTPNPYAPPINNFQKKQFNNFRGNFRNNFNNRNQYNRFNNDPDTPSTYKSWREERESRDPRLSRRDNFQREKSRERTIANVGEHDGRDERAKSVSREDRANSVSRDEDYSPDRSSRAKSRDRERAKSRDRDSVKSRDRDRSRSRDRSKSRDRERNNSASRELPDRSRERAKSVSRNERGRSRDRAKSVSRDERNDSKKNDDYRRKRSPERNSGRKRSRGESRRSRYDEMYSNLKESEEKVHSTLDNLYTAKKEPIKAALQNFKIPKKPKVEEAITVKNKEDENPIVETKVSLIEDTPVVSSDQVSSTAVDDIKDVIEEFKGEDKVADEIKIKIKDKKDENITMPNIETDEKLLSSKVERDEENSKTKDDKVKPKEESEKLDATLKLITDTETEKLAELNSGLPPTVKEEFQKLISNLKEHVGTQHPLLNMFGMLVDFINPTANTLTKPSEAPEIPSSSAEVKVSENKSEAEDDDDDDVDKLEQEDDPPTTKQKQKKIIKKSPKAKKVIKKGKSKKKEDSDEDDKTIESVGERIKNRKRNQPVVTPTATRKHRKNELDKLHEDIKETLGDGVLAVTSKRSCTIQKDSEEEKKPESAISIDNLMDKVKEVKVILQKLPELKKLKRKIEPEVMDVSPLPKRKSMTRAAKAIVASYANENEEDIESKQTEKEDILDEVVPAEITEVEEVPQPKVLRKRRKSTVVPTVPTASKKVKTTEDVEDEEKISLESNKENKEDICYVEPDKNYYLVKDKTTEYSCKICVFKGTSIVDHYVMQHPNLDCLISRLPLEETAIAIKEALENNLDESEIIDEKKTKHDFKCRFCLQHYDEISSLHFFNHLTTHTSEFRFKCTVCNFKCSERRFLKLHYTNDHEAEPTSTQLIAEYTPPSVHIICGYVCSECNYLQLNRVTVDEHIQIYHLDDTACIKKINMSLNYSKKPRVVAVKAKKLKKPEPAKSVENDITEAAETEVQISDETTSKVCSSLEVTKKSEVVIPITDKIEITKKADIVPTTVKRVNTPEPPKTVQNEPTENAVTKVQQTKELDKSVFMCDAVIEDETTLKVSRLEKMKEINASITSRRTSIVNRLKDRLDMDKINKSQEPTATTDDTPIELSDVNSLEAIPIKSTDEAIPVSSTGEAKQTKSAAKVKSGIPPTRTNEGKIWLKDPSQLKQQTHGKGITMLQKRLQVQIDEPTCSTKQIDSPQKSAEEVKTTPVKTTALPKLSIVSPIHSDTEEIEKVLSVSGIDVTFQNKDYKFVCRKPSCIFTTSTQKVFENHCALTHKNDQSLLSCNSCDSKKTVTMVEAFYHICEHLEQEVVEGDNFKAKSPDAIVISDDESPKFTFKIASVTSLAPKKEEGPKTGKQLILNNLNHLKVPPLFPLVTSENSVSFVNITELVPVQTPKNPKPSEVVESKSSTLQEVPTPTVQATPPLTTVTPQLTPLSAIENKVFTCRVVPLTEDEIAASRKSVVALNKWMSPEILGRLFKCPSFTCHYTSANEKEFTSHLETHKFTSVVPCLYCNFKMRIEFYAIHLVVRHRNCRHGCAYCLYRAVSEDYVKQHQSVEHKNSELKVLHFNDNIIHFRYRSPGLKSMKDFLKPFSCVCGKKYYAKENVLEHFKHCHGLKAKVIAWNIHQYNCRYCQFSAPNTSNFLAHMAKNHPYLPLCIVTRHLKDPSLTQETEDETIFEKLRELCSLSDNPEPDVIEVPSDEILPKLTKIDEPVQEAEQPEPSTPNTSLAEDFDESTEMSADDYTIEEEPTKNRGLTGSELFRCATCKEMFPEGQLFKVHLNKCTVIGNNKRPFLCFHCDKTFKSSMNLVEHIRIHGTERIGCSLCSYKNTHHWHLRAHMKVKHKVTHCTIVPADPNKKNVDFDEFIVRPSFQRRSSNLDAPALKEPVATSIPEKVKDSYGPDDISTLPPKEIVNYNLYCSLCNFKTKVRMNLVRHMGLHENGKESSVIPVSTPINPVPCLEKNELMFDKMTNLAISSHATGRMGGKPMKGDHVNAPVYVPLNKRYVCGANNCNYLCLEEAMLKHHLQALHAHERIYTCAHCKEDLSSEKKNMNVEYILNHLRLHDTNLYKCIHCLHFSNSKINIEKHSGEKHADKVLKILAVRENVKDTESVDPKDVKEGKKRPWKCGMCKGRFGSKADVMAHAEFKHAIDSQYKCSYCDFKSFTKDLFSGHFESNHPGIGVDFIVVYYSEAEENAKVEERSEVFDTTPLWMKNKINQVKHIRGILLEDQPKMSKRSPIKLAPLFTSAIEKKLHSSDKKSPDNETIEEATPVKASSNLDLAIEAVANGTSVVAPHTSSTMKKKFKFKRNISKESKESEKDDSKIKNIGKESEKDDATTKDPPVSTIQNMSIETLKSSNFMGTYGPLGKPFKDKYLCPLCASFKTKEAYSFEIHLCEELQYYRYGCNLCTHNDVSLTSVQEHILKEHPNDIPKQGSESFFKSLPSKKAINNWMYKVSAYQDRLIKDYVANDKSSSSDNLSDCEVDIMTITSDHSQATHSDEVDPLNINEDTCNNSTSNENEDVDDGDDPERLLVELKRVAADEDIDDNDGQSASARYMDDLTIINKATRPFVCSSCKFKTARYGLMQKHIKVHPRNLACILDSASNKMSVFLTTYTCYYCSYEGYKRCNILNHIKIKHPSEKLAVTCTMDVKRPVRNTFKKSRIKCGHCDEFFKQPSTLRQHYFDNHRGEDFVSIEFSEELTPKKKKATPPVKMKETARKSTTAASFLTSDMSAIDSYYGKEPDITDEECKRITTTLEIMNNFVTMNVAQLSKLLNIFPRVEIVDVNGDTNDLRLRTHSMDE